MQLKNLTMSVPENGERVCLQDRKGVVVFERGMLNLSVYFEVYGSCLAETLTPTPRITHDFMTRHRWEWPHSHTLTDVENLAQARAV